TDCQIVVGVDVVGPERDGLLEMVDRVLMALKRLEDRSKIVMRAGKIRPQRQCFLYPRCALRQLAELIIGEASLIEHDCVGWILAKRLFVEIDSPGDLAGLMKGAGPDQNVIRRGCPVHTK